LATTRPLKGAPVKAGISLGLGFVPNPDFGPVGAGELAKTEFRATLQAAIFSAPTLTPGNPGALTIGAFSAAPFQNAREASATPDV
jgi:hypothetical protein